MRGRTTLLVIVLGLVAGAALTASGSAPGQGPDASLLTAQHRRPAPRPVLSAAAPRPASVAAAARAHATSTEIAGAERRDPPADPIVKTWQGIDDGATAPADTTGAVGPTRYIQMVDRKFQIYDRGDDTFDPAGTLADLLPASPPANGGFLGSPQVLWDPATSRFYYAFLDLDPPPFTGNGTSYIAFGFSKTASPDGPADFCRYLLDYGYGTFPTLPAGDAIYPDSPKLGDTPHVILLGANVFDWQLDFFYGADVDWVDKPPAGTDCPALLADSETGVQDAAGDALASPVPAAQVDSVDASASPKALPGWVVASKSLAGGGSATQLSVLKVTEQTAGGSILPVFQEANGTGTAGSLTVPRYGFPPLAPQPAATDGSDGLDTGDARLGQAVAALDPSRNGSPQVIWTQHTVAGATPTSPSQVRWYELNPAAKTVVQSGSAGDATLSAFNGAIAPDRVVNGATRAFGDSMVLGFTTSSATDDPAVRWVSKEGAGPQTAFNLVKQSPDPASGLDCGGDVCPWGEYAGASPDPAADTSKLTGQVWLTNAWTSGAGDSTTANWKTQNFAVHVPPSPPTIASFTPAAGSVGTPVTVNGTGFRGSLAVSLGGVTISPPPVPSSSTQIKTTVPPGAETGPVVVTNDGGPVTSAALFKVTPKITGFTSPVQALGTVDVSGANLDDPGAALRLGPLPVTLIPDTSTHVSFQVPAAGVTGKLTFSTTQGSFTTAASLGVLPTIGSPLSPANGFVGQVVTIPGTTYGGTSAVRFTGYGGGAPSVSASFRLSAGVLTATVPPAAVTGPVSVQNPGGATTSAAIFTVDPKITSLTPTSGPVGSAVTIGGSGLDASSTATFTGAVEAGPQPGSTAGALKLLVPAGATTGPITVDTAPSAVNPVTASFRVTPKITGFTSPVHVNDIVDVTGTNLDGIVANGLKLGSVVVAPIPDSPTHLTFQVPPNAVTGKLSITTANGSFTTSGSLQVAPRVLGLGPPAAAGQSVAITGEALTGVTAVRFTGPAAPVNASFTTSGGLKATVPAGAVTGPITVTTAGGTASSASFVVLPKITSITSNRGAAGTTAVTISGSGFQPGSTVQLHGLPADTFTVVSSVKLTATVPLGATTGAFVVFNPGDGTQSAPSATFTVTLTVTSFTPAKAAVGGTVTIVGAGFSSTSKVFFGGDGTHPGTLAATAVTNPSPTTLVATVPAGAGGRITVKNGTSPVTWARSDFALFELDSRSPQSGPTGTQVEVDGIGFAAGDAVTFDSGNGPVAVPFTAAPDGTKVTFTVPDGAVPATGDATIAVADPAVTSPVTTPFTVTDGIASFSPAHAQVGDTVTITGNGLDATNLHVFFNGTEATPLAPGTARQIAVTVPVGATTGKITVTSDHIGPSPPSVSSATAFTVDPPVPLGW